MNDNNSDGMYMVPSSRNMMSSLNLIRPAPPSVLIIRNIFSLVAPPIKI